MLGLGKVEVLLKDENLEEIVINNSQEPLWVYHKRFGWLKTNIVIKSDLEIYNYASMIGRKVGRQITSLNPLMDAHLTTGDRVNATLFPISTKGNTITIRKFARKPWTITDLIKNNTISKEVASLLWLAIQYEMNVLVSGGTATGKTSILNVLTTFIPPNHRIVSIEDSVTGDMEIIFEKDGKILKEQIGKLIDSLVGEGEIAKNDGRIRIFSMDKEGKIQLVQPSSFIRHKVKKKIMDITFQSGRKISVTQDHSLFTLNEKGEIVPVLGKEIKIGSFIATPRIIPYEGEEKVFDLSLELEKLKNYYVEGDFVSKMSKDILKSGILSKSQFYFYKRNKFLKVDKLLKLGIKPENGRIRSKSKAFLPLKVKIDEDLAALIGLWLADGCYDRNSVIFSVVDEESREVVRKIAKRFKIECKLHSDGISLMLNSKLFKVFFKEILGLEGNAYTKRVPAWVFGLRKKELAALIKGYFSGDGWVRKGDVAIASSLGLLKDVQTLLLRFGIPLRIGKRLEDNVYQATISGAKFLKVFSDEIGFLQEKNKEKLLKLLDKKIHDVSDVIPLPKQFYFTLKRAIREEVGTKRSYKGWKSWHRNHTVYNSNIGRELLREIVKKIQRDGGENVLIKLANSDIFWDRVKEIKERDFEGYVYDISVPGLENFICNNVIAHNTREIQLPDFLHWVPLTTREPNPEGKGEVCLYPGTFFVSGDGVLHEISEYVRNFQKIHKSFKLKSNVFVSDGNGETVLAGNPNPFEYRSERIKAVSKITDRKFICSVKCEDGEVLRLTENTRLPVIGDSGRIELLKPTEIKEGFYLPVFTEIKINSSPQKINLFEIFDKDVYAVGIKNLIKNLLSELTSYYRLKSLAKECGIKRQALTWYKKTGTINLRILKKLISLSKKYNLKEVEEEIKWVKAKGGRKVVKIPRVIDEDLAYLAGFLLAEKTIYKKGIVVSQKESLPFFAPLVKKLFGIEIKVEEGKYKRYYILSSIVADFMKKVFGLTKSKRIRVPECIMKSPDNVIASFLAGFIDGDGSVSNGKISLSTSNKYAIREFKYLLTRLGIWSRIYKGKVYTLNITTREDLIKACKILPFRTRKKEKARANLNLKFSSKTFRRARIPSLIAKKYLELFRNAIPKQEKIEHNFYHAFKRKSISKKDFWEIVEIGKKKVKLKEDEKKMIEFLLRPDVEFIKIVEVKIKPNSKNIPTYDITPESSTYFVAGIDNFTLVQDSMLDLMVNALRMRPDRIIVGEIRRAREAEVLFEAMHTGHSVYSTLHADTAEQTVRRLINPPINVPEMLLEALHIILAMHRDRRKGIRRVFQLSEIIPSERGVQLNTLFRWRADKDEIIPFKTSMRIMDDLRLYTGMTDQEINQELVQRQMIIDWLVRHNINTVNTVGYVVSEYYSEPEKIISAIKTNISPEKLLGDLVKELKT
jgi:type IV secretory pathway ATPase VirB11/archaellum biosynthesis ATPase/intein/homing endonuclease